MKSKRLLVALLGLVLMLAVVACGNKETGGKSDDKKTEETAQSGLADDKEDADASEEVNKEQENAENTESDNTQPTEPVVTKTTMYAKSNVNVRSGAGTSNSKLGSLTKGQEVVKTGEENGWSKIEFNGSIGYVKSSYLSTEKVSMSTVNNGAGNTTTPSTPSTSKPEKSPYAGMYSKDDQKSKDWLATCTNICKTGIMGEPHRTQYGESYISYWAACFFLSSSTTTDAWGFLSIYHWSITDPSSYDGNPDGPILIQGYAEVPGLVKQCLEALGPGGTEVYNYVERLIQEAGGIPIRAVAPGRIQDNIPGLYVEITGGSGRNLSIDFYPE